MVVEALECITKGFGGLMDTRGIKRNVRMVQKLVLLGITQDTQEDFRYVRSKHPLGPWLLVVARPRGISRH